MDCGKDPCCVYLATLPVSYIRFLWLLLILFLQDEEHV